MTIINRSNHVVVMGGNQVQENNDSSQMTNTYSDLIRNSEFDSVCKQSRIRIKLSLRESDVILRVSIRASIIYKQSYMDDSFD
jgi:hypothetical protein